MKAVTWHGTQDVRVDNVPDPRIEAPNDAVVRITTTNICGSDLHLYNVLGPYIDPGDILGHEPMGIVEEVGPEVSHVKPGDRVVLPFNISCGHCFMCDERLYSQCETTQVREYGTGAKFFGYTKLYGQVPGGQAEYLRVPEAQFVPIKVPEEGEGMSDERFVYLSDVLPTSWQAVEYAGVPEGGSVTVFGLGPIGQMCARIARHKGFRVIGVDLVPERLQMARRYGVETIDFGREGEGVPAAVREMTDGRGTDSVIDAVGMEAHGASGAKAAELAQSVAGLLPDAVGRKVMESAGVDRLTALNQAIETVRRGGTLSISGVYGGTADPINMLQLFDKQIQVRMGQANVKAWTDTIMPLLLDESDPLGVEDFATHKLPLDDAPRAYEMFQNKEDGAIKVLLQP
ncbi:Threonine dehydrogenase and related Zn-dependent dehydrogenase [Rubrobacter radiotolerans]|uniref:Threonine dehydrogenase and related Zn-dependent dehydrogenase n=1 Tax=Rubrobacter radiotolerans TaxID=42256 RepID=A0A023X2D5_RUBRA|nr:zinc-dependent alcohol dehydrogenase [Rubrobacter radiotolerans]AHY46224.1 Threonine dehydrogenase and related Zn-dependent dehydrogenase [Rubrobacter radiotolerans]MDX5893632.1 zinc-dependent alcohol dehydrogenase [Rubrobacter radiotolerans]SMC04159.1 Threonine dehydrogenase [Rubrobacter radiotolerans DSM 5868]